MKHPIKELAHIGSELDALGLYSVADQIDAVNVVIASEKQNPTPEEVAYAGPNKDGSRKSCSNCWKWVRNQTCLEVEGQLAAMDVCAYHVFGKPQKTSDLVSITRMSQKIAGVASTKSGTSCDNCLAYDDGHCNRVVDQSGKRAKIDPRGCCNAWTPQKSD